MNINYVEMSPSTYVNYRNDDWNVRLSALSMLSMDNGDYIDSIKGKNRGASRFDGYTTFDLSASYRPNGGKYGTVGVGVSNVFNKQYTTVWGQQAKLMYSKNATPSMLDYKGRGRTFNLNYRYDF